MKLSLAEMLRMDISYKQLVAKGMNEYTEGMFKFDSDECAMLGKRN